MVEQSNHLEQLAPVVLSICCFRFTDNRLNDDQLNHLNRLLVARLRAEGDLVPSTTVIDGKLAIRPCYINPRTRLEDVQLLARRAEEIGRDLLPEFRDSPAE